MITTIKDSHPIARKEHICELCGCKINKGQKYYRQTNVFDGRIYDWIEHEECREIASELVVYDECDYDEYDEGLSPDCFKEIIDDYIHREHYNDDDEDIADDWQGLTRYEEVCKLLRLRQYDRRDSQDEQCQSKDSNRTNKRNK